MNHGALRFRRRAAALLAGAVLLVPILGVGSAQAVTATDDTDINDPAFWPSAPGFNPSIDTTAHSIRYYGENRSNTNFATAFAMTGECDYPYDTADRNGDSGTALADTDCWYGSDGSPAAVLITTKDKFADSLTASSISSPGNDHTGPTAVNLVVPSNPTDEDIATEDAPIVITDSTREGATGLSATATAELRYLEDDQGGPSSEAENAIIVGGPAAVPAIEDDLATLGFENVYRIGGDNRNDTAKDVALAMGTGGPGPFETDNVCADTDATDGVTSTFEDNAAPNFWVSATECKILPQTVVLADGGTGADALAIGWFSSYYGVPILLTLADGSLPAETTSALQTLDIQNIIVAGGETRIPDTTKTAAASAAGITADHMFRVAGPLRSDTSVEMAKHLGGWFPTGDSLFQNDMFCVAASAGEGDAATGWPDALGAGPVCGDFGDNADSMESPSRQFPPVNGPEPIGGGDSTPGHDFTPMFLTTTGGSSLSSGISDFLELAFPPAPSDGQDWCSGNESDSCEDPGFGIAFGGPAVVTDPVFQQMATLASGGTYTDFGDLAPEVNAPFFTKLDLSTAAAYNNAGAGFNVCANRGMLKDVQFLAAFDDAALNTLDTEQDVVADYTSGNVTGVNEPTCVNFGGDTDDVSHFIGDSISGHFTTPAVVDYSDENSLNMSVELAGGTATSSGGTASDVDDTGPSNGTTTTLTFAPTGAGTTTIAGTACTNTATGNTTTLVITRGATSAAPDTFTGTFTLNTSCGTYTGNVSGEADFSTPNWTLRGMSTITGGTGVPAITGAVGGFTADIDTNTATTMTGDDELTNFRLDGILGFPS